MRSYSTDQIPIQMLTLPQVTWMTVTIQRYLLILKSSDETNLPSMERLRKISFAFFWISFPLTLLVTTATLKFILYTFDMSAFSYKGYPLSTMFKAYIIFVSVTSIPDMCSLAFYISLLKVIK